MPLDAAQDYDYAIGVAALRQIARDEKRRARQRRWIARAALATGALAWGFALGRLL